MNTTNRKGFTLIELLVVVLIIGILAAMALPQYFKAVERSRMSEAVTLLGNIAQAQQRKYMQINKYIDEFKSLDVSPKGAEGSLYYTKGVATTGAGGNGFGITLHKGNSYETGYADATRYSNPNALQYSYTLKRKYADTDTSCIAAANSSGSELCADFCGIETPTTACCSNGTSTECGVAAASGGEGGNTEG